MTSPEYQAFLDGLKPGDSFEYVWRSAFGLSIGVFKVDRRTPKQIISGSTRYWSETGRRVTVGHYGIIPHPATPEQLTEARLGAEKTALVHHMKSRPWRNDPVELLRAVTDLLENFKPGEEKQ